jgi:hypothetical protein
MDIHTKERSFDARAVGSVHTYLTRYTLVGLTGVVADEDYDGAGGRGQPKIGAQQPAPQAGPIPWHQRTNLVNVLAHKGLTMDLLCFWRDHMVEKPLDDPREWAWTSDQIKWLEGRQPDWVQAVKERLAAWRREQEGPPDPLPH